MSDDLEYLVSKPLVGFQMDASHLHNVLETIIRNQQSAAQSQATVARRLQGVEAAVQEIQDRVHQLDGVVARIGGNEDVRSLRAHVQDLSAVVDNISRQAIPEIRRSCEDTRKAINPIERQVQQLGQLIAPMESSQDTLRQYVDDLSKDLQNTTRQLSAQFSQAQQHADDVDRERQVEFVRIADVIRDVQTRTERVERNGGGGAQLRDLYDELNNRCNENFKQVEMSARAVDTELNRIRSDAANVRTELNTLDNNSRQKMTRITDDMDAKFQMLLETLHTFERNSTELEDHLAAAGRALASSRQNLHNPVRASTTTTTSALRGNQLSSDVRRNVVGDLSDPRRGGSTSGW